jgi:hypothetical protein
MDSKERLQSPENYVMQRRGILHRGVGNLDNVVYVSFGPAPEAKQPQVSAEPVPTAEDLSPEAQLAKVYNLDDYQQAEPQPQTSPEVTVHENHVQISEAASKVAEAYGPEFTGEDNHGTAQAA